MIRKLLAACAASLVCSSASAALIQYDLVNVRFNDGASASGFFIQDSEDRSIAWYRLSVASHDRMIRFSPSGHFSNIISAQSFFQDRGPTSFRIYDDLTDFVYADLELVFGGAAQGPYTASGQEREVAAPGVPFEYVGPPRQRFVISGHVVEGVVDPLLAAALEAGQTDGLRHIVPVRSNPVPEPGSIALLLAGALGAACMRSRSSSSSRA